MKPQIGFICECRCIFFKLSSLEASQLSYRFATSINSTKGKVEKIDEIVRDKERSNLRASVLELRF